MRNGVLDYQPSGRAMLREDLDGGELKKGEYENYRYLFDYS